MDDRSTWTVTTHDWTSEVDTEHLADVRARPDRFGEGGRRHLLLEVLAYACDEAEALGRVGRVLVTQHPDGSATVADDGRGTDTRHDGDGRVIRKPVMATRDVRFFDSPVVLLPDGLPRRGMSVVAALSPVLVHENHRAEGSWSQTYRHGVPDAELRSIAGGKATGTWVTFEADLPGPRDLTPADLAAFAWLEVEVRASAPQVE